MKAKNEPFRQPLSKENAWALVDFLADTLTEAVTETPGDTLVDIKAEALVDTVSDTLAKAHAETLSNT